MHVNYLDLRHLKVHKFSEKSDRVPEIDQTINLIKKQPWQYWRDSSIIEE